MAQDKRDQLYNNLINSGKVGENELGSREQFKQAISGEKQARELYHNLLNSGMLSEEEIGSENDFYGSISSDFAQPQQARPQQVQQPQQPKPKAQARVQPKAQAQAQTGGQNAWLPQGGFAMPDMSKPLWQQQAEARERLQEWRTEEGKAKAEKRPSKSQYKTAGEAYAGESQADRKLKEAEKKQEDERRVAVGQQMRDELDYWNNTGERLKQDTGTNGTWTPMGLAATVTRDEDGNIMYGEDGNSPLVSYENDQTKVGVQQAFENRDKVELDKIGDAYEELRQINALIDGDKPEWVDPITGTYHYNERSNEELQLLLDTRKQIQQRIKAIERRQRGVDSFWDGMVDAATDVDTWTLGLNNIGSNVRLLQVSEKMKRGEKLTNAEQMLVDAVGLNNEAQAEMNEGTSRLYRSGRMLTEMLPFMGQIAATGGFSGVAAIGAKEGQRLAGKIAGDELRKRVARKFVENTGVVFGDVAAGFASATTTGLGNTINDVLQRRMGTLSADEQGEYQWTEGKDWWRAIGQGVASQTKEFATERFGEHMPTMRRMNVWLAKQGVGARKMARAMSGFAGSKVMRNTSKMLRKGGMQGVIPEIIEEEIGLPIDVAIGDMTWEEALSGKQQGDIVGGMFLTVGAMHAVTVTPQLIAQGAIKGYKGTVKGYNTMQYHRYKRRADKMSGKASALVGDEWDAIKDRIDNTPNDEIGGLYDEIIQNNNFTKEQMRGIYDYMNALMTMRGYNLGLMSKTEEEQAEEPTPEDAVESTLLISEDEGYNTTSEDDMRALRVGVEQAEDRLLEIGEEQIVGNLDEDPVGTLRWIADNFGTEEEDGLLARATAYVNAQAAYNGMLDRVRDDIDNATTAASQQIDARVNKADGMIHPVTLTNGGRQADIVDGNVVTKADGSIDEEKSTKDILLRDKETGEVFFRGINDIESMDEALNPEQLRSEATANITDEMTKDAVHKIEDVPEVDVDANENVNDNQSQEVNDNADSNQNEQTPVENVNANDNANEIANEQQNAEEGNGIPKDENGKVQYHNAPMEQTLADLYDGTMDEEEISDFVESNIAEAQKAYDEVKDKKATMSTDKQAYLAERDAIRAEQDEAKRVLDYWNEVKNRISQNANSNANVNENANQEANPVEDVNQNVNEQEQAPVEEANVNENANESQEGDTNEVKTGLEENFLSERILSDSWKKVLDKLGKLLGKRIIIMDDAAIQKQYKASVEGFTIGDTLVLNAKYIVDSNKLRAFITGHEATHILKKNNPEAWDSYVAMVKEAMGDRFKTEFDRLRKQYDDAYKKMNEDRAQKGLPLLRMLSDAEIEEEICCDWAGANILTDEKAIRRVVNAIDSAGGDSRNFIQKFVDWIEEVLQTMRESRMRGEDVGADIEALRQAKDIWMSMLGNVAEQQKDKNKNANKSEQKDKLEAKQRAEIEGQTIGGIETENGNEQPRFSTSSIMEGAGFTAARIDDNGGKDQMTDDEGNVIIRLGDKVFSGKNPVSVKDLKNAPNSVLNYIMNDALALGTITKKKADVIYQKYCDIINSYLTVGLAENGGAVNLADRWLWLGDTVFRTIAKNSDKQYSYSADITRVCKKNEAVIRTISAVQQRLGYGITPAQIMDIYTETYNKGYQVPCAVCYVFSRYIRNGKYATAAINGMNQYGKHLRNGSQPWTAEEWEKELLRLDEVNEASKAALSKASDDVTTILDKIDKLGLKLMDKKKSDKEKEDIRKQIEELDKRYRAALNVVSQQSLTNWIKSFAIQSVDKKWVLREDANIPDDMEEFKAVALDLRRTSLAMTKYPAIQRLRRSGGAAAGKEITFESNNELGELISGVGVGNTDNAANHYLAAAQAESEKERKKELKAARDRFAAAVQYAKRQTLRGGQRMWSWSDNIEELAPDVAINLMQMEMLGGALQSYSKQLEGINLVARMGGYVNGSLMAKDNGWREVDDTNIEVVNGEKVLKTDIKETIEEPTLEGKKKRTRILAEAGSPIYEENGKNYVLIFDDVIGIDPHGREEGGKKKMGLFGLNKILDKAGNIIVGMNDRHVRAALADKRIFFIIPWHASGANVHILQQMLGLLGTEMKGFVSTDYTKMQEEKDFGKKVKGELKKVPEKVVEIWETHKNENRKQGFGCGIEGGIESGRDGSLSPSQWHYRELRDAIFDGKIDDNPEWKKEVENDAFLSQVYHKIQKQGLEKMTSTDKEFIYPYEYWDEKSTYDKADINGARYVEYCRRLGFCPKFSGKWDNDRWTDEGNFIDDKGYWKLLIDRRMYDTKGKFQDLTPVDSSGFSADLVDPVANKEKFFTTQVADNEGAEEIADAVIDKETNRTGTMPTVDYGLTMESAVDMYNTVADEQVSFRLAEEERPIQGLEGYTEQEVLDVVRGEIESRLADAGVEGVTIKDIALHGSRLRGDAREDSDLDVVMEYDGDISEDGLFNIINEEPIEIDGVKVDVNPITEGKSGTMAEYMQRSREYDERKRAEEQLNEDVRFRILDYTKGEDVTLDDYYIATEAKFETVAQSLEANVDGEWEKLKAEHPDWEEKKSPLSDSQYLIDKESGDIYRKSDHWGRVSSCTWKLGFANQGAYAIGKANIKDFKRKEDYLKFAKAIEELRNAKRDNAEQLNEESAVRFRVVTDPKEIERLEAEPKVKVYRAMQMVDGNLYPPMAGKINGEWQTPIQLGTWEQSDEHPELADENGKFKLDKGNGSSPMPVAYNPYLHTSRSPLNDQFSSAWNRPELVTVEVEIPESELTSGYKAEKAKDAVGEIDWKSGSVSGKLAKMGNPRKVILSRYDKPVRVVPNEEVAQRIAEMLKDTDLEIPFNTVTPELRDALVAQGVKIGAPEKGNAGKKSKSAYEEWKREENPNIRFRISPEEDAEYMKAVEDGDMDKAQQMVNAAAKKAMPDTKVVDENGEPLVVYHGSPISDITAFDLERAGRHTGAYGDAAIYASDTEDVAEVFSHEMLSGSTSFTRRLGEKGKTYPLYMDIKNPFDLRQVEESAEMQDILKGMPEIGDGAFFDSIMRGIEAGNHQYAKTYLDFQRLQELGYDGVIARMYSYENGNDAIEYGAFAPNQIKSADPVTYDDNGNVIPLSERFNEENPDIRFRVGDTFYSNAEHAVEGIKQEKATPEQWLKMIEKAGGLKAGEDKWLGLSDWLKGQDKKSLTKQEVMDFIRENQIQVKEVWYGDEGQTALQKEYDELIDEHDGNWADAWDEMIERYGDDIDMAIDGTGGRIQVNDGFEDYLETIGGTRAINDTRLGYTTEGLENKKEIALVVPTIESWNENDDIHFGDAGNGRAVAWIRFGETTVSEGVKEYKDALERWSLFRNEMMEKYGYTNYESQLTEEEKANLDSLNEEVSRTAKNAKTNRVLVIDEIQSKRHQEGREKGYKWTYDPSFVIPERERYSAEKKGSQWFVKKDGNTVAQLKAGSEEEAIAKHVQTGATFETDMSEIPDAPFDKNWHELAMKRMLRYAAENGYDKIAWTKGAQQAERYSLAKTVKSINRADTAKSKKAGIRIFNVDINGEQQKFMVNNDGIITGSTLFYSEADGKPLSDYFGKEWAVKMMTMEDGETLDTQNAKVGGEGMKGFYDQMLPRFMDKYGKKWGVKTQEVELPNVEKAGRTMWSVDITPEMKESVMQGQPMFKIGEDEKQPKRSKKEQRARESYAQRQWRRAHVLAEEWAGKLNLGDRISFYDSIDDVPDSKNFSRQQKRNKGWYDPDTDKIVVVYNNHRSPQDVLQTILREGVARYGLRELFGENYDTFLDNVWDAADIDIKEAIAARQASLRAQDTDKRPWYHYRRIATEDYLARLAEDTDFERADRSTSPQHWFNRVKTAFLQMLRDLGVADYTGDTLTDNELRYILWRSYKNLSEPDRYRNPFRRAENIAMQIKLDVGNYAQPSETMQQAAEKEAQKPEMDLSEVAEIRTEAENDGFAKGIGVYLKMKDGNEYHLWVDTEDENEDYYGTVEFYGNMDDEIPDEEMTKRFGKFFGENINKIFGSNIGELILRSGRIGISLPESRLRKLSGLDAAAPEDAVRFMIGDPSMRGRVIARNAYERMVSTGAYQFQEAVQDSMLGLKRLYQAILGKDTHIEDVKGYQNAYLAENRMSSVNAAEQHEYFVRYMKPLLNAIGEIAGADENKRTALTDYLMAKHGLERNEVMAQRDYDEYVNEHPDGEKTLADFRKRDYAGLTDLTGTKKTADAEVEAQRMVDDYELVHDTRELWRCINNATKATLAKIYASGMLSKERYEQIQQMYEYYIPLRGWDETTSDEVYGYLTSNSGLFGGGSIKKAKGRSSKADDPIATIAMMADDAIRQGNRNKMKQTFHNFVLQHPSDLVSVNDLWLQYDDATDEWIPVFADIEDGDTAAVVEGKVQAFEERMEQLAENEPKKYKRGRDAVNIPYKVVKRNINEHQVLVQRDGRSYVLTINGNPRAAQALNGLTNPNVDIEGVVGNMLKGAEWINRNLSAVYTTRNPDFVVSNYLRDTLYSNCMTWVKEDPDYALRFNYNFGRFNPFRLLVLMQKWENGTLDDSDYIEHMFRLFMLNGGETGYTNVKDIEGHKREIAKELKTDASNVRHAWSWLGTEFDVLNRCVENNARFAAFLTSMEKGRSLERSIYDAKEVSVNFNKKGSGGKMVNATGQTLLGKTGAYLSGGGRLLYVFWNAGVQGTTNFAKAAKRHPVKALSAAASMYALGAAIPLLAQAMAGAAGGGDDDDKNAYYNLPEYVRRSNIIFKAGDQWVTIPLPIEFRAWYGLGELATGVITGKERYSDSELAFNISSQVSQIFPLDVLEGGGGFTPFIPSSAKPLVEAYILNKSWSGLPIYRDSPWNKTDPEWTKAYQSANAYLVSGAKWLNEISGGDDYKKGWVDINPAKVEYLLSGMFGGLFTTGDKLVKMGETAFGEREFDWRNMLLANRVIKTGDERTESRKLSNEYFKYKERYDEVNKLLKRYAEAAPADERYRERLERLQQSKDYLLYDVFGNYEPLLQGLNEAKKGALDMAAKRIGEEETTLRREMVNLMHAIEDDKNPDYESKVDSMLNREYDEGRYTRRKAGNQIAKRMGGTDTYGNPSTEYGKVYERKRDHFDLAEDVLLQVAQKKAKEDGNEELSKALDSARRDITKAKKPLGEVSNEEDVDMIMENVRALRNRVLHHFGILPMRPTEKEEGQ